MLLLLLSMLDKGDLNQKLRSALDFYRQNKDLINLIRGAAENRQNDAPSSACGGQEEKQEKKESRPSEGRADSVKILEEYLRRSAV